MIKGRDYNFDLDKALVTFFDFELSSFAKNIHIKDFNKNQFQTPYITSW